MTINELYEIIKTNPVPFNTILNYFKVSEINETHKNWDVIGGDLDFIELIMKLEIEYDIQISDNLCEEIESTNLFEFYKRVNVVKMRNEKLKSLGI
jgi:acyl carrier protein